MSVTHVSFAAAATLLAACAGVPAGPVAGLEQALAALRARPELAGSRLGVCVVDAADGRRWLGGDDDRGFATASNMKLLSAAVALTTLGPEHRFVTELWQQGTVADGVLTGELRLRGHGDPSFGTGPAGEAAFAKLVAAVQASGVQRLVGRVVGDDAWLGAEHLGLGWQWDYLDEDYAAPFGALCCAGNVVRVQVRPGAEAPLVTITPDVLAPALVQVRQLPNGSTGEVVAHRALGSEVVVVGGSIAADGKPVTVAVPVPDPAAFAARVLQRELAAAGVAIDGLAGAPVGDDGRLLASVASARLAELVQPLLGNSDNLYAEQVVRSAARAATGDGSTAAMARHVRAVLDGWGIDTRGMVVADGSGLSRRNLVQPRQLVGVLAAMWRSPYREVFVQALPLAGRSGTLRNRFVEGPASGRVRAKTGYISRVVCLSGFVPRPDPQAAPLVFSVMLNDFTCDDAAAKAAVDAFVQQLAVCAGW
jgi:D-alanyl-D-alanine carboxypeptidase/D-alanyl-D-alanine-endopeptidase (penicillin-binding protein 4)